MNKILYCVKDNWGNIIARDMNMDNVMIFVRAMFDHYDDEEIIAYTVKRQKENGKVEE